MKKKVLVAMSGGVDSSVSAVLLKEQGYEVIGVTIKMLNGDYEGTCCSLNDVEDARNTAYSNDFLHYVFNFTPQFKKEVIDRFAAEYLKGNTPNPCIDCNQYIKFGKLFERAIQLDIDYVATGHFARIDYSKDLERYLLKKGKDKRKDQSYVLYSLTQQQLSKTIFPLGEITKQEVRSYALEKNLSSAQKEESQDICFVDKNGYVKYIQDNYETDIKQGYFLDLEGNILGTHKGYINYTIGQRKGLFHNVGKRQYVLSIDSNNNNVIIGDKKDLYKKNLLAKDVNMIMYPELERSMEAMVKIRYNQNEFKAMLHPVDNNEVYVEFNEPQPAVTPGQAVVFYNNDIVIGGGRIK